VGVRKDAHFFLFWAGSSRGLALLRDSNPPFSMIFGKPLA